MQEFLSVIKMIAGQKLNREQKLEPTGYSLTPM